MTPEKPHKPPSSDLFRNRLDNLLNQRHELYRLADLIDWSVFDTAFGSLYCPDKGCPAKATRLMVGLQYLKHREPIEPVIGHLKSDGLLGRNYPKGTEGDQMNVVLSCVGHNLRLILRQLRIFCAQIWRSLWTLLVPGGRKGEFKRPVATVVDRAWQLAIKCR